MRASVQFNVCVFGWTLLSMIFFLRSLCSSSTYLAPPKTLHIRLCLQEEPGHTFFVFFLGCSWIHSTSDTHPHSHNRMSVEFTVRLLVCGRLPGEDAVTHCLCCPLRPLPCGRIML